MADKKTAAPKVAEAVKETFETLQATGMSVDEALAALRTALALVHKIDVDDIAKIDVVPASDRKSARVRSMQVDRSLRTVRVELPVEPDDE